MSVNNDSIQTLLKQRRELRHCLQELRSEISSLNQRADKIVEGSTGETLSSPTVAETPEPVLEPLPEPSAPPAEITTDIPPESMISTDSNDDIQVAEKPELVVPENAGEVIEEDNEEDLLYKARLLSDHFLDHPAPVDDTALNRLDTVVKKIEQSEIDVIEPPLLDELRNAYRPVAAASFRKTGVTGASLAESQADISLLWGVPFAIAGMVLVAYPLILLLRTLANRMFIADFANDISFVVSCLSTFLWGLVGTLANLAWGVAREARNGTYRTSHIRAVGLKSGLGGVLGITLYLMIKEFLPTKGIVLDSVAGICAFFIGWTSTVLYAVLYRFLGKVSRQVSKKP